MLLIDTSMVVRRCYAKMDFLKNSKGIPTGMEFGTLRIIESLQRKFPDQKIILCLDSAKSWRKDKYPTYKQNRSKSLSSDYYERYKALMTFLRVLYPMAITEGYEADDIMFTLAQERGAHLIYTNDHDLLQAVSPYVTVVKSFKSQLYMWDEAKVFEEYGVPPKYLAEFFAFIGDKGDDIPGLPRVPRAYLAKLIVWARTNKKDLLKEILTAEWKGLMEANIHSFIKGGHWAKNFELIKLKEVPVRCSEPIDNKPFIVNALKEWEIYSLKLCKEYGVCANEEF